MGGSGSGNRYRWGQPAKKAVVEDCLNLNVNRWVRETIIQAGRDTVGAWQWLHQSGFTVNYGVRAKELARSSLTLLHVGWGAAGEGQEALAYPVGLTTTVPRFGGLRWWFLCPLVVGGRPCIRRVGKLYLPWGGRYFGCRTCYDLTYTSCQKSHEYEGLYRRVAQTAFGDPSVWKMVRDVLVPKRYVE